MKKIAKVSSSKNKSLDTNFSYTTDQIVEWSNNGLISKKLANEQLKYIDQNNKLSLKFTEFKKNNPDATDQEINTFMNTYAKRTTEEEMKTVIEFHSFLVSNMNKLLIEVNDKLKQAQLSPIKKPKRGMFPSIDLNTHHGISNGPSFLMFHARSLLEESILYYRSGNSWEVRGEIQTSSRETVVLKYDFEATSSDEANKIFENYKNKLLGEGLRTWMALWRTANELGSTDCSAPLIEIMKFISSSSRTSNFFSPQEKQNTWNAMKILTRTVISIERNKDGKKKAWNEYPLLNITGGEKEHEKYPKIINFNLYTGDTNKGFFPVQYKNSTIHRPTARIFFAFKIQTRAAQKAFNYKETDPDYKWDELYKWEDLFFLYNLEATAQSNQSMAKTKILEEMQELKNDGIIEDFTHSILGITIMPDKSQVKQNKKTKPNTAFIKPNTAFISKKTKKMAKEKPE